MCSSEVFSELFFNNTAQLPSSFAQTVTMHFAVVVVALGLGVVVFMHLSALRCKYTRVRTESEVKQRKNEHAPQISAELNMRTQP